MKTLLFVWLVIGQSISSLFGSFGVWNLKCDEKVNPVGVSPTEITFSWEPQSQKRNVNQTDYRIVVSSSLELLNKGKYDVWDSKKVRSSQSVHAPYQGSTLKPATKYYWKAMVWDAKMSASKWSDPAWFVTSLNDGGNDWMSAKWIGYEQMPAADRTVPGIHGMGNPKYAGKLDKRAVVPYFRKAFSAAKPIKEAFLFISGLGHYEASLNGSPVGKSFIAPGWTQYDKTVLYNCYDVKNLLSEGNNAIGVTVGNGFYYVNRERYLKLGIAYGYPMMICRLKITYEDGTEENILSDADWKTAPSPTTYSSIYGGEDYDARMEQPGWSTAQFDVSAWKQALLVTPPKGKMKIEQSYPVALFESFPYTTVKPVQGGKYTFDFGQNASGIVELTVTGKKGQTVTLYPGELINQVTDEVNQGASGKPYYFTYTLKGDGTETWRPSFTYYGLRYVTVEGARPSIAQATADEPVIEGLSLIHNRNSNPQVGKFECSSDLMNRIHALIDWAIRSNMQSVVTDCPHREKLGWLEQTHLMGNSIRYNYNIYHLYRKQVRDMIDAQLDNGLVPDIAPEYTEFVGGFRDSPEWGSAAVLLPWMVYKWYGDVGLMAEAYDMMTRYVNYLKGTSKNHIVNHGLGDWFDYGPNPPGEAQLTPKALTATAIYYYDVKLLAEMARLIGRDADVPKFTAWAKEIKTAFNAEFYDPAKKTYSTSSQTAIAMPLCVGLVDEKDRKAVFNSLLETVKRDNYALTAGDVGFHYLVWAMGEGGFSEDLYKMVNRDDVPGYGYQLAKGATALTESWPALEVVSNNHLMLGHIMEWFYTHLLGINDAPDAVASNKLFIAPTPVGDVTSAKGSYQSPRGLVSVDWKISGNTFTLDVKIPDNTTAELVFPAGFKNQAEESSLSVYNRGDMKEIENTPDGKLHLLITTGGEFSFSVMKAPAQ